MTFKETLGKIWHNGLKQYLAAYMLVSTHAHYDFFTNNLPRIEKENAPISLEIKKFEADIGGRKKRLTLVGEYHIYNKKENEFGKRLVKEHTAFANECSDESLKNGSIMEKVYLYSLGFPYGVYSHYANTLANGRTYYSISDIASEEGKHIHALEKPGTLTNLPFKDIITLQASCLLGMLTAPIHYYTGKNETPYKREELDSLGSAKLALVDRRDKNMATSLVKLLKSPDIDNLLATVGRAHLDGVINNLSQQIKLVEVK